MERMNKTAEKELRTQATANSYDAVPRDGPAVFVADAAAWDRGEIRGVWVDALTPPGRVVQRLPTSLVETLDSTSWRWSTKSGSARRRSARTTSVTRTLSVAASAN